MIRGDMPSFPTARYPDILRRVGPRAFCRVCRRWNLATPAQCLNCPLAARTPLKRARMPFAAR